MWIPLHNKSMQSQRHKETTLQRQLGQFLHRFHRTNCKIFFHFSGTSSEVSSAFLSSEFGLVTSFDSSLFLFLSVSWVFSGSDSFFSPSPSFTLRPSNSFASFSLSASAESSASSSRFFWILSNSSLNFFASEKTRLFYIFIRTKSLTEWYSFKNKCVLDSFCDQKSR